MEQRQKGLSIQERDLAILRGLFESRILAVHHISAMHFGGRSEAAKKRLQKLKAYGLIKERPRYPSEPSVLSLTNKGIELLRAHGILGLYPPLSKSSLRRRAEMSDQTVAHELAVADVKAGFVAALAQSNQLVLEEFSTWPLLYRFQAPRQRHGGGNMWVRPDGFVRIRELKAGGGSTEYVFMLELDNSTERLDILLGHAIRYHNYFQTGGFAASRGTSRADFKKHWFRVLFVFRTEERMKNFTAMLMEKMPRDSGKFLFATHAEATTCPLQPILEPSKQPILRPKRVSGFVAVARRSN